MSISSISSTLPFAGVLGQRRWPVEHPPQRAGAEVVALVEALADVLGAAVAGTHRLRVAEPAEGVESPLQVLALAARMDHVGDEQPFEDHGGGACQLALARSGFAAHQQRPLRGQRGTHRPGRGFVETVHRRRPRTVLRQGDFVAGNIGDGGGVHGLLASCSGMVRKLRMMAWKLSSSLTSSADGPPVGLK
ncbi:MAG TPA: hypothetical protein PLS39_08030 [Accumulibacter sp.]|nr:hypothetical protein [Accumulibacter sp.]HND80364.1 hypothetical protein [Accumulibacter sp.]HNL15302.1 hypothetical protein [Accumulibacter sp.]